MPRLRTCQKAKKEKAASRESTPITSAWQPIAASASWPQISSIALDFVTSSSSWPSLLSFQSIPAASVVPPYTSLFSRAPGLLDLPSEILAEVGECIYAANDTLTINSLRVTCRRLRLATLSTTHRVVVWSVAGTKGCKVEKERWLGFIDSKALSWPIEHLCINVTPQANDIDVRKAMINDAMKSCPNLKSVCYREMGNSNDEIMPYSRPTVEILPRFDSTYLDFDGMGRAMNGLRWGSGRTLGSWAKNGGTATIKMHANENDNQERSIGAPNQSYGFSDVTFVSASSVVKHPWFTTRFAAIFAQFGFAVGLHPNVHGRGLTIGAGVVEWVGEIGMNPVCELLEVLVENGALSGRVEVMMNPSATSTIPTLDDGEDGARRLNEVLAKDPDCNLMSITLAVWIPEHRWYDLKVERNGAGGCEGVVKVATEDTNESRIVFLP